MNSRCLWECEIGSAVPDASGKFNGLMDTPKATPLDCTWFGYLVGFVQAHSDAFT